MVLESAGASALRNRRGDYSTVRPVVGGRFIRRNTRHGAGSDKDKGEAVDRLQSKVQGRGSRVEGRESRVRCDGWVGRVRGAGNETQVTPVSGLRSYGPYSPGYARQEAPTLCRQRKGLFFSLIRGPSTGSMSPLDNNVAFRQFVAIAPPSVPHKLGAAPLKKAGENKVKKRE